MRELANLDGQVEDVLCDAVALSNRERRWVEVPL